MSAVSYTLYENDASKYVGGHKWQISTPARLARRLLRHRAYTRWIDEAFTEVRIEGAAHLDALDGSAVFIGNHQSHLDTLLVHAALPERIRSSLYFGAAQDRWFVKGKKKLELQPWYQSLALGNFPIVRGGGRAALAHGQWLLSKGQSVFLFPEGTRARHDRLGEFKHGATLLAREASVPVVPLYLSGLKAIRPTGSRVVEPGPATLKVLPPIDATQGHVSQVTQKLWECMNDTHGKEQAGPIDRGER